MTAKKEKNTAANQKLIKGRNLSRVFETIREREPISRAVLAKKLDLSPTTVSALVDELCAAGMVREIGALESSISGRRPIMLEIARDGGYVIGIELAREGFTAGLFDLRGALCRERIGSQVSALVPALEDMLDQTIAEDKILGIAIGIPAIVDKQTRRVISSTLMSPELCHEVFEAVKKRFPAVRVQVGNESSFSAYCEKSELDEDIRSLVYVEINDGIGAGIIIDNRIFTGAFGNAGELGHMSVDLNGPKCPCGNRGCIETLASVPVLCDKVGVSFKEVRDRIAAGDERALSAMREVCRVLAVGLNNLINLINPEAIVLGGKMARIGSPFINTLREELNVIAFEPNVKSIKILSSRVSGNTACRGAARYLLDGVFHSSEFWID